MFQQSISVGADSIQPIQNSYTQSVDNLVQNIKTRLRHAHVIHMLDRLGTLLGESLSKAQRGLRKQRARVVAIVIGIALSMQSSALGQGSIDPIQSIYQLADYQLTEKQEACHDLIAFKESSNNRYAQNGSHHGYYQGKSSYLKDQPDDVQFYWYWHYVANRYGVTEYDEPDYCKALHHLRVKGWQ